MQPEIPATLRPINDRILVRRLDPHAVVERHGNEVFAVIKPKEDSLVVLAELDGEKEISHGQIIEYENMSHRGEVVEGGPGKWVVCPNCTDEVPRRRPMSVRPGDVIYFGRFVDLNYESLCIMQEDDIIGIDVPERELVESCR